ncbi:CubicO group peptidase, beta-lactamase class C family [Leifsonia sp. 98AMF]|uniref:serine hydrolase domain-containing protein n=1 Tax=unclassified Leifsonia TaxID=2663824 RepID=UPI00087B946B|nr:MULTISPECIES: serine hydrolase [unclassified Leifsonia]SDH73030.1 CubicO group peptidase, beta-lactamase class C family [Leifsonia sp. 197AMF]SDJ48999.1 CubicO group peptidase, beta-lactamase class C family [Leifsonia sp. 466MF]SDK25772.1 CubicO group peptidase, beta-lactamase class C family [Leifsonia sp. 157MF]SDN68857.1 CubicO group peptidase, beta-lactamase class C family [Leifsonia sp. 509MF]SEN39308.1 CubicO group peptidase, beta-lactamase class C family [Leifsonia sp. 467MF]
MTAADQLLDRFVRTVDREGLGAYGAHALVGDDEADHRWRSDDRVNVYSVSKGVSALAAGIAVDEGVLTLDTTVAEALPGLELGDGVGAVTLRHLLTMSSGIDFQWFGDQPVPGADLAQEMLRLPTRGPGEHFLYSDASTYVAMRMLGAAVGDVRDWLLPRLFDPLGIDNPQWMRCPLGWIVAGSGLQLRTEELARIGRLLRDRGEWRGSRIVSAAWIDGMHADWRDTGSDGTSAHYGIATWEGPSGLWRFDGRYGQYVVVDDARGAVLTVTAHEEFRTGRLLEVAHEALLG